MRKRTASLLAVLLLGLSGAAWADAFSPYSAVYSVSRDSFSLGQARYTLTASGKDCYLLQGEAVPSGLAALLAGRTREESHFCFSAGGIRPQRYSIREEGGDKDRNYSLNFDWVHQLVRTDQQEARKLPADALDPLVIQVAMRKLLHDSGGNSPQQRIGFSVVEDDRIKSYSFAVTGRESLKTPLGTLETVRLDRVDDRRKQLRFWLAPSLDYLPVMVERQRRDDPVIRLRLEALPDSPAD